MTFNSKSPYTSWVFTICLLLIFPSTPALGEEAYPRLIWRADQDQDYDLEDAIEMLDDGTSGDETATDGIYSAELVLPEDEESTGEARSFFYRIIPPQSAAEDSIGDADGNDFLITLPDESERTIRVFFSTARSTALPTTADCPDPDTLLSCLGFAPIPGISDDWNFGGAFRALGDHQAFIGGSAWDTSSNAVIMEQDHGAGEDRRSVSFLSGNAFGGSDGWMATAEGPEGVWLLGPDGWHNPSSDQATHFELISESWQPLRFELLTKRGMARQIVDDVPLSKPLLTELVTEDSAPFIEIHNPSSHPLVLAGLHLTNHPSYPLIGASPEDVDSDGFVLTFRRGDYVEPRAWVTVSLVDSSLFESAWGRSPDYVFPGREGSNGLESAYTTQSAVGATPSLPEAGGFVTLFYYEDSSDLVRDVDIVVWGNPEDERALPDKTGLSVGSKTYGSDSMRAALMPAPAGRFLARNDMTERNQRKGTEYNGIVDPTSGQAGDESDEPIELTWALAPAPTPGEAPEGFIAIISGVVRQFDDDEPIEGALVRALPGGPSTESAADGSYSIEVEPGQWTLEASKDRYLPHSREAMVSGAVEIDFELRREPGVVIAGRVRDDLGRWVSGARVDLVGGQRNRNQHTEDDGGFSFSGVQPNTLYTLSASKDGYRGDSVDLSIGNSDRFDIVLTLTYVPVAYAVSGRVISESDEEPVAGALVSIADLDASTTTDKDGEFTFRLVPPGTYTLGVVAQGFAAKSTEVEVSDADLHGVEVRLGQDGESLELKGSITMAGLGLPISGANLSLVDSEAIRVVTQTDSRGLYSFTGLSPGRFELSVEAGGYDIHRDVLDLFGSTTHDIALDRPAGRGFSVQGQVRLEGTRGDSPKGSTLKLAHSETPTATISTASTDDNGIYSFQNIGPGHYHLEATREGYAPAALTIVVSSDTSQHFILHPQNMTEENGVLGCDCSSSRAGAGSSITLFLLISLILAFRALFTQRYI